MCLPRRSLLTLLALLVLLPAGSIAVAHTHLLSAGPQAEPAPPDLGGLPRQPVAAHEPPSALTPAARVDAQALRAASGAHDASRPLPNSYSPTPRADSLVFTTPTAAATATTLLPPSASTVVAAPPGRSATPTPLPLPPRPGTSATASATPPSPSGTPSPTPTPSMTPTSPTPAPDATPTPTLAPAAATATPLSH